MNQLIPKKIRKVLKNRLLLLYNIFDKKYITSKEFVEPVKQYRSFFAKINFPSGLHYLMKQKLLPYDNKKKSLEKDFIINVFENVYIDMESGTLITDDRKIISQSLKYQTFPTITMNSKLDDFLEITDENVSVITSHFKARYYHIWFDAIVKLFHLSRADSKITIAISEEAPAVYHQILKCFEDIFQIRIIKDYRFIKVRNAHVVHHKNWAKHAPVITPEISEFFKKKILFGKGNFNYKRIYIKRKNGGRDILNEDEVEAEFVKYGFELISFEDYSIFEQAQIISNAEVIAGLHGAGFTNLIFSHPGQTVIEMQNHAVVPTFFFISYQLGLKYIPIFSLTTTPDFLKQSYKGRKDFYKEKLKPVKYDVNEVENILKMNL